MINVKLDEGAIIPSRAHEADAGYDLFSRDTVTINPDGSAIFDTGVHMQIPIGFAGFLKSKSGLNVNHKITSDGVIDAGYTGSIVVQLYNNSKCPYTVHKGDKISQIVIIPCLAEELNIVDELNDTERGNNGFGSTGR